MEVTPEKCEDSSFFIIEILNFLTISLRSEIRILSLKKLRLTKKDYMQYKLTPVNSLIVDTYIQQVLHLKELTEFMEIKGLTDESVIAKVRYIETLKSFSGDPHLTKLLDKIKDANKNYI